jgi:hypothetical protein
LKAVLIATETICDCTERIVAAAVDTSYVYPVSDVRFTPEETVTAWALVKLDRCSAKDENVQVTFVVVPDVFVIPKSQVVDAALGVPMSRRILSPVQVTEGVVTAIEANLPPETDS